MPQPTRDTDVWIMDATPKRAARDAGAAADGAGPAAQRPAPKRARADRQQPQQPSPAPAAAGPSSRAAAAAKPPAAGAARRERPAAAGGGAPFDLEAWAGEGAGAAELAWLRRHLDAARRPKAYPGGREYTFVGDPMSREEVTAHYGPCSAHWPSRRGFLLPPGGAAAPPALEALETAEACARARERAGGGDEGVATHYEDAEQYAVFHFSAVRMVDPEPDEGDPEEFEGQRLFRVNWFYKDLDTAMAVKVPAKRGQLD
ncbi:MAG: hypothetical protein J3K34DRAFT_511093, partial [Monoraphidium minutum]